MRLFHFSEQAGIDRFVPRPPLVLSSRRPGDEWLNGPLVWAIDEAHDFLYFFPRDCPRIVAFATPSTSDADRSTWLGDAAAFAFVETGWLDRIAAAALYRYELPGGPFEDIVDAGMHVARSAVTPLREDRLTDLPRCLTERQVALKSLDRLAPLRELWRTSLHVSGIRLRNAIDWTENA